MDSPLWKKLQAEAQNDSTVDLLNILEGDDDVFSDSEDEFLHEATGVAVQDGEKSISLSSDDGSFVDGSINQDVRNPLDEASGDFSRGNGRKQDVSHPSLNGSVTAKNKSREKRKGSRPSALEIDINEKSELSANLDTKSDIESNLSAQSLNGFGSATSHLNGQTVRKMDDTKDKRKTEAATKTPMQLQNGSLKSSPKATSVRERLSSTGSISENSLRENSMKRSITGSLSVFDKLNRESIQRKERQQALELAARKTQEEKIQTTPTINNLSRKIAASRVAGNGGVNERLYQYHQQLVQKKEKMREKRMRESLEEQTYKPMINKRSQRLQRTINAFVDWDNMRQAKRREAEERRKKAEEESVTAQPQILERSRALGEKARAKSVERLRAAKAKLGVVETTKSQSVGRRRSSVEHLVTDVEIRRLRQAELEAQLQAEARNARPKINAASRVILKRKGDTGPRQSVSERLYTEAKTMMKERSSQSAHQHFDLPDSHGIPFQPKVNRSSKYRMDERVARLPVEERLLRTGEVYRHRYEQQLEEQKNEEKSQQKSRINAKSQILAEIFAIRTKISSKDRVYWPTKSTQAAPEVRIDLTNDRDQEEGEECTFMPAISSNTKKILEKKGYKVSGGNAVDVFRRAMEWQERSLQRRRSEQRERLNATMEECTFEPTRSQSALRVGRADEGVNRDDHGEKVVKKRVCEKDAEIFLQRNLSWLKKKEAEMKQKRSQQQQLENEECTFRPLRQRAMKDLPRSQSARLVSEKRKDASAQDSFSGSLASFTTSSSRKPGSFMNPTSSSMRKSVAPVDASEENKVNKRPGRPKSAPRASTRSASSVKSIEVHEKTVEGPATGSTSGSPTRSSSLRRSVDERLSIGASLTSSWTYDRALSLSLRNSNTTRSKSGKAADKADGVALALKTSFDSVSKSSEAETRLDRELIRQKTSVEETDPEAVAERLQRYPKHSSTMEEIRADSCEYLP